MEEEQICREIWTRWVPKRGQSTVLQGELLRQIETHLEKIAELAAQADVSGEELCEMLRALREENEP